MLGSDGIPLNRREILRVSIIFFINVGFSLAMNFNETPTDLITGTFSSLCDFEPPTAKEIHSIIMKLKDFAEGHDGIRSNLIKEIINSVIEPLIHIFSLSLRTGVVPHDLKVVKVIPLYKSRDHDTFTNYHSISILPCFSKILENLVYAKLSKHLVENNILYKHQYGCQKKYSLKYLIL